MSDPRVYARIVRRESNSSRSGSAIVVLLLLSVVVAWVGIESVYAALGRPALLFSPVDVLPTLSTALSDAPGVVIAAGAVSVLVGIVLLVLGLTAGRRGRHAIDDDRVAAVVDDRVIASSLARTARVAGRLSSGQVDAWVSRRKAQVRLTPTSGVALDEQPVLAAVRDELAATPYRPSLTAATSVATDGRLGS